MTLDCNDFERNFSQGSFLFCFASEELVDQKIHRAAFLGECLLNETFVGEGF